jgi:hypothetical protein
VTHHPAVLQCFSCRRLFHPPLTPKNDVAWPYGCPECGERRRFFGPTWWYGREIADCDARMIEGYK